MPVVYARNNQAGPTVLSSDPKGTHSVEWQGKGDPNGGDVQPIPEEVQNTVAYTRALRRGIIVEVSGEEAVDAFDRQRDDWDRRTAGAASAATSSIEHTTNNDIVATKCIGPDTRGQGACGADVTVRDAQKGEVPPLCSRHEELAPQYVPSDEMEGTKIVRKWTRVIMGARERQQ